MTVLAKAEGIKCCKCGVDDALIKVSGDGKYYIQCRICGRRTAEFSNGVQLWNAMWQWATQNYEGE